MLGPYIQDGPGHKQVGADPQGSPTHISSLRGLLTVFRKEWLRMGSSAARAALLSMMKTRIRLVKMWWLMSLWQPTRILWRKALHGHRPEPASLLQAVGLLGGETRRRLAKGYVALVFQPGRTVWPIVCPHQSPQPACGVSSFVSGIPQRPFHPILTHEVTVLQKMKDGTGD